jgi:DNA-binding NarL/FixJ family response regulator
MPLRLVLIEDHQALREGLELLLGREGCDVVGTAGTAARGRELVERLHPDVALVDIRLGDDDGIRLTAELVDADPEQRVVLYTGSSDIDLLISGLDSGARGYALKEGTPSELTTALTTVAQGLTGEQVAERLFLSPETIKTHIRNAMSKLEATTRVHAIAIALREGYISSPPAEPSRRS